jgi:biofilm PGA synthesis N-glycosyltransferase PgaC
LFSTFLALEWIDELSELTHAFIAWFIVGGIAIVPGFMSAFLVTALLLDTRPRRRPDITAYPDISILIAAYNESESILSTLESIDKQNYPGTKTVYVINDGSSDNTAELVRDKLRTYPWLRLIDLTKNAGKANALNVALREVTTNLTITIDGDSYLFKDALKHLIGRYLCDPQNTAAVAGAVLVRNSRKNLVTKVQEWDYFHGIAAIKRLQSLFQGTLVAQGAFSVYSTDVLRTVGGWKHVVGEDIVLTWDILERGYRVGYAEDALLFTNAPDTWKQFFNQRRRWSRGLIEAFKAHWRLLFKPKMITLFIWWNLMFPWMDLVYTFAFIPGLILAMFGIFWIAGPITMILLPMALMVNYILFIIQSKMFEQQGLKVRKNPIGFAFYAFLYSIILQPACVIGYIHELVRGSKKNWGTK